MSNSNWRTDYLSRPSCQIQTPQTRETKNPPPVSRRIFGGKTNLLYRNVRVFARVFVQHNRPFELLAAVLERDFVRSVEAAEVELARGIFERKVRAPLFVYQVVEHVVGGFFREVAAQDSAVENVFAARRAVYKVPICNCLNLRMAKPQLVEILEQERLLFLADFALAHTGETYFGDVNRAVESREGVEHVEEFPPSARCGRAS